MLLDEDEMDFVTLDEEIQDEKEKPERMEKNGADGKSRGTGKDGES